MKREIRTVDAERGIIQCTYPDERWYHRVVMGHDDFVPSVTWITSFYPKGEGLMRFVGKHGYDEAEEIKAAAGDRGSKVHKAIERLVGGGLVDMESMFENPRTLEPQELTADEYFSAMTFVQWCDSAKPVFLGSEYTVWNEKYHYAGTVDLKCRIAEDNYRSIWIIDVKTSQDVWPSNELQISAYKHAEFPSKQSQRGVRLAILQVGYRRNKKQKFKLTPVQDQFTEFLALRRIWAKECDGKVPLQREYPLSLSLSPSCCLKQDSVTTGAK